MARKKIGDLLVERGSISPAQLEEGLRLQSTTGRRLGEVLVDLGYIEEDDLIDAVSERLGVPKLSVESLVIDPAVIQRVNVEIARRFTLIPIIALGNTITVAMADPLNILAIDELRYHTGAEIKRTIGKASEIKAAIDKYYSVADSIQGMVGKAQATDTVTTAVETSISSDNSSPIVEMVNLIISRAVSQRASDIHLEPDENQMRIRYRVHSIMREEAAPPKSMQSELISRIKIAADLDVSEKRIPQDGRMAMVVDGNPVDLRISTLPTIHGEKVVIRLLDRRNLLMSFGDLGFAPLLDADWRRLIGKPEGLILISGPTSSGKTTTLYATLQAINSVERNIVTVEDPVEYSLPLINQVQINEKAGLTFPMALRAMLRQNPDTIMIGEIRDPETARMAVRSALTGHLVLSTVHTNDAPSAVARLVDMGLAPYLVATSLTGVLAQRLLRVNCPDCTQPYEPATSVLEQSGLLGRSAGLTFQRGTGCSTCGNSGFKGLTGIYEYFEITPEISNAILEDASAASLRIMGRKQGYQTLFEVGLERVAAGDVCLEELLKETAFAGETDDLMAIAPEPSVLEHGRNV